MAQTTPRELREQAEAALVDDGARRRELVAELAALDGALWHKVVRAVEVEVPLRRIRDLTGLSPTTIRRWAKTDTGRN